MSVAFGHSQNHGGHPVQFSTLPSMQKWGQTPQNEASHVELEASGGFAENEGSLPSPTVPLRKHILQVISMETKPHITGDLLFADGKSQSPFLDRKPAEIGSWKDKYPQCTWTSSVLGIPTPSTVGSNGGVWISEPHFVCHVSRKQDCMVERGTGAAL